MGASSLIPSFEGSVGTSIQIKRLDDEFGAQVIDGAKSLISAQKPVLVIEFSFGTPDSSLLHHRRLILQYLLSIYNIFDIEGGDKPILDTETFDSVFSNNERKQANLLCLPK